MTRSRRERLEQVLEGYFDTKTRVMVERVLAAARPEELEDDAAMDALYDEFIDLLEERYDREDAGWQEAAEGFLRREFDRQVEQVRATDRALLDEL